jgi:hypothetical protein
MSETEFLERLDRYLENVRDLLREYTAWKEQCRARDAQIGTALIVSGCKRETEPWEPGE